MRLTWLTFFYIILTCCVLNSESFIQAQDCVNKNSTFKHGEELTYVMSYNWFVMWTEVGQVTFNIEESAYNGIPTYHYTAHGKTFDNWNWIFPVDDLYQTQVDRQTLKPYYFRRDIREGRFNQLDAYEFNHKEYTALSNYKVNDHDLEIDTVKTTACTFDVLSALLFARNMNYTGMQINDTTNITVILDRQLYSIYFRYLGIEPIKIKHAGEFECMKFSVLLIEGSMFHEGESLKLWVTNDKNHIPVYAETPILVGAVKARILKVRGNRHPFTSLKKE